MKNYLKDLFVLLAFTVTLFCTIYYMQLYNHEIQYKKRIIELTEKRNNTVSVALETVYQDSINNVLDEWLNDGAKW